MAESSPKGESSSKSTFDCPMCHCVFISASNLNRHIKESCKSNPDSHINRKGSATASGNRSDSQESSASSSVKISKAKGKAKSKKVPLLPIPVPAPVVDRQEAHLVSDSESDV